MLDPVSALQNIYSVAKLIYDQTQFVKANQEQCKRLAERIQIIEERRGEVYNQVKCCPSSVVLLFVHQLVTLKRCHHAPQSRGRLATCPRTRPARASVVVPEAAYGVCRNVQIEGHDLSEFSVANCGPLQVKDPLLLLRDLLQ